MKPEFMFTSESVTDGHPDKLCDQVSDAIVDRFLEQDPCSRVIAECAVSNAILFIASRFSSASGVDFTGVARRVIQEIGYDSHEFNGRTCSILTSLKELPREQKDRFREEDLTEEDIDRITVSHQVTVFGFACRQSPTLMPLPIWLAHKTSRRLNAARLERVLPYLAPDGRAQIGVEFQGRRPRRIHSITLVTSQTDPQSPAPRRLESDLREAVIGPAFTEEEIRPDGRTQVFVNPDGPLIVGGPAVHSGLTGRKNAVDTYGEYARHSERALSGKDPMRIDRVGAYAARHAAKNVVAAGLADECEVQISYSIGTAGPVSLQVETFGTGRLSEEILTRMVEKRFDFRVAGILRRFNLRRLPALSGNGFYRKLAAYGHLGRADLVLPWEQTELAAALREEAGDC